jgi:hypothetical protein
LDAFALFFCAAVPPQIALAIDMLLRDYVKLCCCSSGAVLPIAEGRCCRVVLSLWLWVLACVGVGRAGLLAYVTIKGLAKFRWEKSGFVTSKVK